MPSNDDDTATHGGGGPLSYWLQYKVWGVPGWAIVIVVFVAAFVAGAKIF